MDREITIIRRQGSGELQMLVDGVEFSMAELLTLALQQEAGQNIPGGLPLTSQIESHRDGGPSHAHILGTLTQGTGNGGGR